VLGLAASRGGAAGLQARVSSRPAPTQLSAVPELCAGLPHYKITGIKSSNLGGKGPDTDKDEGIFFDAEGSDTGLSVSNVVMEMHAAADRDFAHDMSEGDEVPDNYQPMWTKENGYYHHFAKVNVKPGNNVTVMLKVVDPNSGKDLVLPRVAIAFFDLDTGKGGTRSVEYLKIRGYTHYFLTNSTELTVTHDNFGDTIFSATKEGNGDDNPTHPLTLTAEQKDRVVSFDFHNVDHLLFQLGASEGKTARVFTFTLRPALRCADTKLADGSTLPADDPNSPVTLMRGEAPSILRVGGARGGARAPGAPATMALAVSLLALLAPRGGA